MKKTFDNSPHKRIVKRFITMCLSVDYPHGYTSSVSLAASTSISS